MTYNEYGPYAMHPHVSSASQVGYRNPHIETDRNTQKTADIIQQMFYEQLKAKEEARKNRIIDLIILISTLFFAAATYFRS